MFHRVLIMVRASGYRLMLIHYLRAQALAILWAF
jgi:hypothetical protein